MRKTFCLHVWGDYACFTRPEMKIERVSYEIITPSAARAVFEAILWKPALRWEILKIELLKPINWLSVRRNEVKQKISTKHLKAAMNRGYGQLGLYVEEERVQRAGLFLRDVAYRIHATFTLQPAAGALETAEKYTAMFERRARAGQCFMQPYLGCREFPAFFEPIDADLTSLPPAQPLDKELGWMLYDMDYTQPLPNPMFFSARLQQGVLTVPSANSPEVRR